MFEHQNHFCNNKLPYNNMPVRPWRFRRAHFYQHADFKYKKKF